MGLLDLLASTLGQGGGAPAQLPSSYSVGPFEMSAPPMAPAAPAGDEESPGLLKMLAGINLSSDTRDTLKRALATPLENSPFPLQAGWNGMSSALKGANTYEDEQATAQAAADKEEADRKIKQQTADQTNAYRMGSLGVAQQRAGTDEQYRRDMADAALGRTAATQQNADTNSEVRPGMVTVRRDANRIRERQVDQQGEIGNRNATTRERQVDVNDRNADTRSRGVDVRDWARQDLAGFRQRQGDISQQGADARTMDAQTRRDRPSSWNKPPQQLMLDAERQAGQRFKQIDAEFGVRDPGISRDERGKRFQAAAEAKRAYRTELYQGLGIGEPGAVAPARPATRTVPAAAAPAAAPAASGLPAYPAGVPQGSAYSPSRKMWRSPDGQMFDADGQPVQ